MKLKMKKKERRKKKEEEDCYVVNGSKISVTRATTTRGRLRRNVNDLRKGISNDVCHDGQCEAISRDLVLDVQ